MSEVLIRGDLEEAIDAAAFWLVHAPTAKERDSAWMRLKYLHSQRSPERVDDMERAQGLAR